ncbi:CTD kinase subunit beta [Candida viswanathii]|uniref:CTD kinase subunit beta n=1 Tax=Candida viswanathii TaxID=5486 RepID=A0A367Y4P0_9ASCO|nr:CTD kinase subunit beta [Candida viswanathii]
MSSKELTPLPSELGPLSGSVSNGGSSTPSAPTIVQISRQFFTHKEISYLHNQTIPENLKPHYTTIKHKVFQFLFQAIKQLKFPIRVLSTTMNYYQRYYLFNLFEANPGPLEFADDPYTIAISCLLLATKVEDCIKRLKDIQTVCNKIRDVDENRIIDSNGNVFLDVQRKYILSIEFKLLQIIKFDFHNGPITIRSNVDNLLIQFCKNLKINYRISMLSWLISFDIISTPLSLVVPPHCIALSIIIISLNLKPKEMKLSHTEEGEDDDAKIEEILKSIDCEELNCPEVLVNEAILYILDYYIHQYQYSILNAYLPATDPESGKEQVYKFMDLKSRFNDMKIMDESSCTTQLNETDDYLTKWDYSISAKGSSRFMLSNKRRRFNPELIEYRKQHQNGTPR